MQIVVKNLNYTYSAKSKFSVKALKDVNLTIDEGEFFGIIGHTGSGKSTFIQHLNGLIKVGKNCGEIYVGDFNLTDKKCDFKKLRTKVGMVFQYPEYQLFAETVFDDVAFGLKSKGKVEKEEIENKVREAIEKVGLNYEEIKEKSPFDLSGGQKRRVAIAGVIVTKPEILVLDEPIAGLDPRGKREFFKLLHSLHNDFVKTIIIVSHDMDSVAEHCSKIAVFNNGEIYATLTPKELFSRGEELINLGLDLPMTAQVVNQLKEKNIDVETDYMIDNFIDSVCKIKKK